MNTNHLEADTFGKWLRRQRRMKELTQQALADQVGIARITLRKIEAGTLKPSEHLTILFLKLFGVSSIEHDQWIRFARGKTTNPDPAGSGMPLRQRSNLPAFLTSFIGRVKEQREVLGLINKHRLVTLIGSGGVGKTRLSIKVGELISESYLGGIWFIDLAPLTTPASLPQKVASLFGITAHSSNTLKNAIFDFLRYKKSLFIFDNCEHLIEASAVFIDELLKICPYIKVLATSREPLEILGEAIYRVENLELPGENFTSNELNENPSVQLFVERSQLRKYDFSLTQNNALEIIRICQLLEGHPLAIELAAVHADNLSLVQIADQLHKSIDLLSRENRAASLRQKSIRACIEWGWRLLTEEEKILLRRLSIFSGGWTVQAAQEICGEGLKNVSQLLERLVSKSFIQQTHRGEIKTRYSSHELIRRFAYGVLKLSGEETLITLLNLRETSKGRKLLMEGLLFYEEVNDRWGIGWSLNYLADVKEEEKLKEEARKLREKGLYFFREIKDSRGIGWTLIGLAENYYAENNISKAELLSAEAFSIFHNIDDKRGIARSLTVQGMTANFLGKFDKAGDFFMKVWF